MKFNLVLVAAIVAVCCSCSPSDSPRDQKRAEAGETEKEDESMADWQLQDDSNLIATIEPWPPTEGTVTLKVELTSDDDDRKFAGTLAYRIAPSEQNSSPWVPISKVRQDQDGSIYFAVPVTLAKGEAYVQFRVRDKDEKEFTELTDWKITVK